MTNSTPAQTALNRAMIRWSLTKVTPVRETATSWLYRVEQGAGRAAALKILKSGPGQDEQAGGELLAWYAGEGAATVFDAADGAVFMEWLDGVTLARAVRDGRDDEASIAIAHLVGQLHRRRPDMPKGLTPLRQHFAPLFSAAAQSWPYTARDLFARCVGIGLSLFDKPTAIIPLHGDLHHDNILSSDRGWLAIDPKGLLGDPAYDLANVFRNPQSDLQVVADPARIGRLADTLSTRLGYDRKRLIGWAAAHAGLSACWSLAEEKPITLELAILPLLLAAYDGA